MRIVSFTFHPHNPHFLKDVTILQNQNISVRPRHTSLPDMNAAERSRHRTLSWPRLPRSLHCTSATEGSRLSIIRSLTRARSARPANDLAPYNLFSQTRWH
jgi:hypothetical protein